MKGTFINILAELGFKQAIQNYVFKHQSKRYQDNMVLAFVDSKGRKYCSIPNMNCLPMPLLEKLNELQEQLRCKLPSRDLDSWVEAVEKVLNGNSRSKVTDFGYWLGVLKDRRTILFDPTLLMEIAALLYIREDENPAVYNAQIHKEKFQMLWDDSQKGGKLYDFFQQAGLSSYIPSQKITQENWQQSLEEIMEKVEKFNSALMRTSTLGLELGELAKNSEKTS